MWAEERNKLQKDIEKDELKFDTTILYGMTNNTREETADRDVFHDTILF